MTLTQDENGRTCLKLEGDCTVEQAAKIRDQLQQALESAEGLELDLSSVSRADASLQQLICSAHRSFSAATKPIRLKGQPAQAVLESLQRGGFGQVCIFSMQDCLFKGVKGNE